MKYTAVAGPICFQAFLEGFGIVGVKEASPFRLISLAVLMIILWVLFPR